MIIIPAIDIIDGKCVRLSQGDYAQKKIYNENPVEVAKSFEDAGLSHLHVVDLDGAKAGKVINWKTVEKIVSATKLHVDFGGGIKTENEIAALLDLGVKQVNVGSIAIKHPEIVFDWIEQYGSEKIILSADVRDQRVHISGWQEETSTSIIDIASQFIAHKIRYITCTDIATDGMLAGPNTALYEKLVQHFPGTNWIASGGVSKIDNLIKLKQTGVHGAIVGKAIYEGKIKLAELSSF